MTEDKLVINKLKISALIGVLDHERLVRQDIFVTLDLFVDIRKSAQSDDLNDTIDYAALCTALSEYVASTKFLLIESLAEAICHFLLSQYPIQKLRLYLEKPDAIFQAESVGIELWRYSKTGFQNQQNTLNS